MLTRILSVILVLFCVSVTHAQHFPVSKKLTEENGIGPLKIGELSSEKLKKHLKSTSENWYKDHYEGDDIRTISAKKLKIKDILGLKIARIEAAVYEDAEYYEVSRIVVLLQRPKSKEELNAFYKRFKEAYKDISDMMGIQEDGTHLHQWMSGEECGAMMSLPYNNDSLEGYLPLVFSSSCGG